MRRAVSAAIGASGVSGVSVDGIDPMWLITIRGCRLRDRRSSAPPSTTAVFKRGAYNFAAMAHDDEAIREIEAGASAAFVELRERQEL